MRRPLLLGLLLGIAVACSREKVRPTPPSQDASKVDAPLSPLAARVDALFETATREGAFSGTVVVVDDGKQVLTRGYGDADREQKRANAADTIFRLGSLTKQFTASAILALASDGKLSVTDP